MHELHCGRLRYRTIPEGYVIEWNDPYLWPYLNIESSVILIPCGTVVGAIEPPPSKRGGYIRGDGLVLGIEVLPVDADVPAPSAASPVPRNVPERDVLAAARAIVDGHPEGTLPLDEETFHQQMETLVGAPLSRERALAARDVVAPHFKRRVGRPRKSEQ